MLENLVIELGLSDRVHFVGKKAHIHINKWYAALDVFVVPRKNVEVCRSVTPLKALQAQALGIPVVASDLPALREVTGGFAQYVTPENPEALAGAIQAALKAEPKNRINSEQYEWLQSRTWEKNAQKIIDIYSGL